MMNIKRLELDLWMSPSKRHFDETIKLGGYTQIEPKFNHDGFFLQGKDCWFEVNGQAFTGSNLFSSFMYTFKILQVRELNQFQTEALGAIVRAKLATPEQQEMYGFHLRHGNKFDINDARRKKRLKGYKVKLQENRLAATSV